MRTMATICILLITFPAFAGTFRDDFEGRNLGGWQKDQIIGKGKISDSSVITF